ncbi:MAG TPA: Uma2 family endonuclease [Spirochaetota bacterium]|nr:Uma2 family endonuclease [Spirochaetota bacterium]HOM10470.1 Uma2 family endonuclease [Spirochaetota bacterium]HPP50247.1 Uma2 family endonuclease [Spirochaetota bacterium]
MPLPKPQKDSKFTYADYLTWTGDERWELIDGVAYDMTPAPDVNHQVIVGNTYQIISEYLEGKTCRVFLAPIDVRLPESDAADDAVYTVVQPDVVVVCDPEKIEKRGIIGAPDLVVEVLSESTAYKDETEKLNLYERHGVKEYWIVNPGAKYINVFQLKSSGRYSKPLHYRADETFESSVLPDLVIDCARIFKGADV